MQSTDSEKTWQTLSLIRGHAERESGFQFTNIAHLLNAEVLTRCYLGLRKDSALGADEISWQDYGTNLRENIEDLHRRLKAKSFKPLPVKRIYIAKSAHEKRPLGLPSLESKIVEKALAMLMECIYEIDFLDCSYGYRPGKNCHQALKRLGETLTFQPVSHIVEADIKGFFDNVSHENLMNFIKIRIQDASILFLIERIIKAGRLERGVFTETEGGIPQGGILSPLLANVYLHYTLDNWFKHEIKHRLEGFSELIRYADDFVILVKTKHDADRLEAVLHKRFEKYGLELHSAKSRAFSFGRFERQNATQEKRKANTFKFLGFTHFCDVSRAGRFKVGRKTSSKKLTSKLKLMGNWLKKVRNMVETPIWWKTLGQKLAGHYQYYGVSENSKGIIQYYKATIILVRKWMNRRSQKGIMSWEKFNRYLTLYPLPKPYIKHNFYGAINATR